MSPTNQVCLEEFDENLSPIYSIRLAIFYLQKNSKFYKECMPLVEFLLLVMILHFLGLFFPIKIACKGLKIAWNTQAKTNSFDLCS